MKNSEEDNVEGLFTLLLAINIVAIPAVAGGIYGLTKGSIEIVGNLFIFISLIVVASLFIISKLDR